MRDRRVLRKHASLLTKGNRVFDGAAEMNLGLINVLYDCNYGDALPRLVTDEDLFYWALYGLAFKLYINYDVECFCAEAATMKLCGALESELC